MQYFIVYNNIQRPDRRKNTCQVPVQLTSGYIRQPLPHDCIVLLDIISGSIRRIIDLRVPILALWMRCTREMHVRATLQGTRLMYLIKSDNTCVVSTNGSLFNSSTSKLLNNSTTQQLNNSTHRTVFFDYKIDNKIPYICKKQTA